MKLNKQLLKRNEMRTSDKTESSVLVYELN